ncbi:hypothetical protein RYX56_06385 [Alkalihalophilus lindianensis]|uniref:Uncharacterized protein n=1 Tax=Alkalihalophilus lindianensis TaxID=1630542 RepID=A0ABU3X955_9BACI|nr:hypothetical protein [Alkalihalophilus lindianensis]MDV2683999.1 hypothetical protein [Alkalihalophilus lindianensis]
MRKSTEFSENNTEDKNRRRCLEIIDKWLRELESENSHTNNTEGVINER